METTQIKDRSKVIVPYLIASVLMAIAWGMYIYYFSQVLPDAFRYNAIDWGFSVTALDFLAVLAVAVIAMLMAFKKATLEHLIIPIFVNAAIIMYTVIDSGSTYGYSAFDAFFLLSNFAMILSYVLFGAFLLKKSNVIIFAAIATTVISAFNLFYNIEQFFYVSKYSQDFGSVVGYVLLSCQTLGYLVLVWTVCALESPKTDSKDIIKKNIILSVVLSIVTLGIYAIFWVKTISDDIAKLEDKEVNSCLETAMFFTVPFYSIYWLYIKGKKTAKLSKDADMSVLFAIQGFFWLCFLSFALMQSQLHLAIGLYEKSRTARVVEG